MCYSSSNAMKLAGTPVINVSRYRMTENRPSIHSHCEAASPARQIISRQESSSKSKRERQCRCSQLDGSPPNLYHHESNQLGQPLPVLIDHLDVPIYPDIPYQPYQNFVQRPHFTSVLPHDGISLHHPYIPSRPLHDFGRGPTPLFGWDSVIPLAHGYGQPKYVKHVKPDYRRFCFSVGKADVPYAALPGGPLWGYPTTMSPQLVGRW